MKDSIILHMTHVAMSIITKADTPTTGRCPTY